MVSAGIAWACGQLVGTALALGESCTLATRGLIRPSELGGFRYQLRAAGMGHCGPAGCWVIAVLSARTPARGFASELTAPHASVNGGYSVRRSAFGETSTASSRDGSEGQS